MLKHQFFPLSPSPDRHRASLPTATGRLPTPRIGALNERGLLPVGSQKIPGPSASEAKSLPAKKPAMGQAGAIWQSVLGFFLEGFALYGASLHWVATTAVTAIASEVDARQRQSLTGAEGGNLPRSLRMPFIHPRWPAMIWGAIASKWTRWRREREIKKAVVALAELDNRTLRDMGIPHPSQIERVVRYGRDS